MFVASINSTGRACIAPVTVTALHYYPGSNIVRLPTVVPPLPIVVNNNFGFVESFTIRNNHHFHLEASLDCGSTSKFNNGSSSKYNNSENNMDKSASSTDAVVVAEEILLIRQNKQALRRIIRSRINSTYPNNNESGQILSTKSNHVFSRLFDLPQYKHAKSIGFFLSMPSGEIQTKHAMQKIVTDGKVVYVPRVGLDFEMCDMDLIRCDTSAAAVDDAADGGTMFYDNWPRNKWGIPEPPITASNVAKPGDIDLLIVPGLAFDTNGHRLGQGKQPPQQVKPLFTINSKLLVLLPVILQVRVIMTDS